MDVECYVFVHLYRDKILHLVPKANKRRRMCVVSNPTSIYSNAHFGQEVCRLLANFNRGFRKLLKLARLLANV